MAPLKRQNHILEEAECLALRKMIAQEEAVVDTIRKVQSEHEAPSTRRRSFVIFVLNSVPTLCHF